MIIGRQDHRDLEDWWGVATPPQVSGGRTFGAPDHLVGRSLGGKLINMGTNWARIRSDQLQYRAGFVGKKVP